MITMRAVEMFQAPVIVESVKPITFMCVCCLDKPGTNRIDVPNPIPHPTADTTTVDVCDDCHTELMPAIAEYQLSK